MADLEFTPNRSSSGKRRQSQKRGLGAGAFLVMGFAILAGIGGIAWWQSSRDTPTEKPKSDAQAVAKAPTTPLKPQPDSAATVAARNQRERELAELERQRETLKAETARQERKTDLLRQLNDLDARERKEAESLTTTIANLQQALPEAEAFIQERRKVIAGLQRDIQLGRAFGAPQMPGNANTREAALDRHLQLLRAEEAAVATAKAQLQQAETSLKLLRSNSENERRRIRKELED